MRILLIFPPVSPQFHMPYLSVPALGAYLKREEPSWEIRMSDLNIELARKVMSPDGIKRFKDTFKEQARKTNDPQSLKWFKYHLRHLWQVELFLRKYPSGWRDSALNRRKTKSWFISNHLTSAEIWLNNVLMVAAGVEHRKQEETIEWAESYPEGIMTEFFSNEVAPRIISFNPSLIGFSWVDHGQVIPTLVLLNLLKEKGFRCRTVVGGPFISLIWDRLPSTPILSKIDHFVTRQGEEPLLRLARSVNAGEPESSVGRFLEPRNPDINRLPPPDFGDFKLDSYFSNESRLCLLGSWGCYWGNCSFCNARRLEGTRYRLRRPEKIVEDMIAIKERYHPDNVRLSDNAISFHTMTKIAEELIRRNVELPWITNTRFDGNWTEEGVKLLVESRCIQLLFGLESASENIMNLINKGTDLNRVRHILSLIAPTGIRVHFYMIIGYPGETRKDWEHTLTFFKDISRRFPKLKFSTFLAFFGLQIQSHMYREPGKHHIEEIFMPDPKGWATLCRYRLSPNYTNFADDTDLFIEMKNKLDAISHRHLQRQKTPLQRIWDRLWSIGMKLSLLT